METIFNNLNLYLRQNEGIIAEKVIAASTTQELEVFSKSLVDSPPGILKEQMRQYVELLAKHAVGESNEKEVKEWGETITEQKVKLGLSLDQSIMTFNIIREVTWEVLDDFSQEEQGLTAAEIIRIGKFINEFIDIIILSFTTTYTDLTNRQLRSQQEVIDELSTPVISIVDGVAVLPIIGNIDTHRAKILMEQALHQSNAQEVECLIIDMSGVYIVDTMVAHELFKIISSLELTGVEVNITGIRPELAHSIVNLGIHFDQVKLYNNLGQALKAFGIIRK